MSRIPEGLSLQYNVINEEKEREIVEWIDSHLWSNELSRRTQHYGYVYNYKNKNLVSGPEIKGPILEIAQMFSNAGLMNPVQCIVNEYYRDQGIAGHIDNLAFGPVIIGLSIGADVVMVFERGKERFECFLPRRSVVMMYGPARYEWKHAIEKRVTYIDGHGRKITKPADYRRISLTYREIAK
jgi:alkylated DNA repair dioxygenase AlkB